MRVRVPPSARFNKENDMSDAELLLIVESRKKSGVVAALLNLVLPGAGYMYCGRWILGIFAFLIVVVLFVISLGYLAGFLALVLILDGFLCAGRYNRKLIERVLAERAAARPQGFADARIEPTLGKGFADG